jgi:ABC-2 type transport system permease protein
MRKPFLVAQREIKETLKTKGFWIGVLLFPVIFVLATVGPTFIERKKSVRTYVVRDSSGWLAREVEREGAVSDTRLLLLEAQKRQLQDKDVDRLPDGLRELAPVIAKLPPSQIDSVARAMALGDTTPLGLLAPENRAAVIAGRPAFRTWWDSASALTIRGVSNRTARGKYQRVNAEGDDAKRVANGSLFAIIDVGKDPVADNTGFAMISRNLTDDDLKDWFEELSTRIVRKRRLEQERISPRTAAWLNQQTTLQARTINDKGEESTVGARDRIRQVAPMVFVYILWISIFSISQGLMLSTIEEKSTRISEVLLSSVSPVQLMSGKILGVAATGLMTITTWVISAFVAIKYLPRLMGATTTTDFSVIVTDPVYMASFVIYFLLGYLFYAAILMGIGSVVNTIQEAQALMMPVMMSMMLPLLAMVPIGRDPNGAFAKVLSWIPPFTPFVMMNRAAGPPTIWEYIGTTILMLLAVWGALWAGTKVFRIGILMTGKPPKASEILNWIRTPVGMTPGRQD